MKLSNLLAGFLPRATSLSLLALLSACGSPDSILGAADRVAPVPSSVIAVAPADDATDVSTNLTAASATFDLPLESPACRLGALFA